MIYVTPEKISDYWEVEALYDLCFAPGREALSSYRLREGIPFIPEISLVIRDSAGILGAVIRYWPIRIGGAPALLLGPVAVHPTRQGEGLGALLITESLQRAYELGWEHVLLVGDQPYYKRFGFVQMPQVFFPPHTNPDRVLGQSLTLTSFPVGAVTKYE